MAIKILYCFVCFFLAVIFMLFSQDKYLLDIDTNQNDSPIIEFTEVENHRLNENETALKAKATKLQRFEDKDVFFDIDILTSKDGQTLRADNGTFENDIIYLNGNVVYTDQTGNLTSNSVEYHQKSGILKGANHFKLKSASVEADGDSFVYNTKKEKIEAQQINAVIRIDKL